MTYLLDLTYCPHDIDVDTARWQSMTNSVPTVTYYRVAQKSGTYMLYVNICSILALSL